jgi:hypothetical protein
MTQATTTNPSAAMPTSLHIIGPAFPAFAQASVHIRAGMIFHPDRPVELFNNGNASFYLVQGNPDQIAINMARESNEHALALQAAEFKAAVKREAAVLVERQAREALEKKVTEAVAAHEKEIAKLRRQAEAELAKLNQQ